MNKEREKSSVEHFKSRLHWKKCICFAFHAKHILLLFRREKENEKWTQERENEEKVSVTQKWWKGVRPDLF